MSDRPRRLTRSECTKDQRRCWDALTWAFRGAHHFGGPVYECGYGLRTTEYGEAATFDSNLLTRLVVVAHRFAVRIAITQSGPNRIGITAHPRKADSECNMTRHATTNELRELLDKLDQWEEWSDET
jgi:hypothetical protein